jgi:hypothetical protein
MTIQWTDCVDADAADRCPIICSWSPHVLATYQIYKSQNNKYYDAIMWDGTSLFEAVVIKLGSRTINAAKRACEKDFATGEAEQRMQAIIEAEERQQQQLKA